ncbi:hypothetical protein SO802_014663 [Lithocarpus litseifolius]|uniref:CCHC-type domain-containing protein n=1 Tax=Lithocarpus litseifolius TaxID=425828 RepID=A0AAW2CS38_9ROSI
MTETSTLIRRSSEEEDELQRSVKKFKDSNGARNFSQPRSIVSYRDTLLGEIPGAYEQAFSFARNWDDADESDTDLEPLIEGMVEVKLSKETFSRIRAPWSKALIVKVYGEHFLAIKPWEPYFKASEAKLSSVVMWVRLPELPIEFYDAAVLREIGSAIGPVLRIDSYTASESRGSYARICVQVDLDRPLITSVRVGRLVQKVSYEGVSTLCFSCGRLGHKRDSCPYYTKPVVSEEIVASENTSTEQKETSQLDSNYGPWMVVTRKKNFNRSGRPRGPNNSNQENLLELKGKADLSEPNSTSSKGNNIRAADSRDLVGSARGILGVMVVQNQQRTDIETDENGMDVCQDALSSKHAVCNGKNQTSTGNASYQAWEEKVRGKELMSLRMEGFLLGVSPLPQSGWAMWYQNRIVVLPDENQSQSDRNTGLVRGGVEASVEAHFSHNPNKHQIRKLGSGSSCLEPHTQPVVEVSYGCSSGLNGGIRGVEQAAAAISHATLGRIGLDHSGKEASGFQRSSHDSYGKSSNSKAHPNSCSSAAMQCTPLLQGGNSRHFEIHDDLETRLDGIQGYTEEDGMEYGGSSCNEY